MTAAAALAAVVAQENAALAAGDLPGAARLLAAKTQAMAALQADPAATPDIAAGLVALVTENRRLLERAILVQGRVIAAIARAAPRALPGPARYGRTGAPAQRILPAMALSARA